LKLDGSQMFLLGKFLKMRCGNKKTAFGFVEGGFIFKRWQRTSLC
jgi:hypothetical protein